MLGRLQNNTWPMIILVDSADTEHVLPYYLSVNIALLISIFPANILV